MTFKQRLLYKLKDNNLNSGAKTNSPSRNWQQRVITPRRFLVSVVGGKWRKDGEPAEIIAEVFEQHRIIAQFENRFQTLLLSRDTYPLLTKYLIKWKRIGRMRWKFRYWCNLGFSTELDRVNRGKNARFSSFC